jgi:hypothetical protein
MLEKSVRDKRSSLLRKFITYGRKKFYNIGPWMLTRHKTLTMQIKPKLTQPVIIPNEYNEQQSRLLNFFFVVTDEKSK